MPETMLDAHVRFEVARWEPDRLRDSIAEEIAAAFEWLATVTLSDLADPDEISAWIERVLADEVPEPLADAWAEGLRSVHAAAAEDDTRLNDLVPREVYDRVAGVVIGMQDARSALIEQVTTSEVYSQLISHVLYQGIKNYVLAESPVARRVPGASSLMRLGQSALSSTGLEKGIDRQLTAFVNANVSDTIRDSRAYLDSAVDEEVLRNVAAELWDSNAAATVADAAALVADPTITELVAAARDAWAHVSRTPAFQAISARVVADFFAEHGDRPVADLLEDAGVTRDRLADRTTELAGPAIRRALDDGFLERRIRTRLAEFYDSYERVE